MKKTATTLLVIALFIALTACSESTIPATIDVMSTAVPDSTSPALAQKPIAENEHVTVSFEKLYEEEYVQGAAYLTLAITSKADQEIWVYLENASVNDEQLPMVGSGVPMYIKAGKTSRNPFILSYKTLTIESVAEITTLEFDIVVADKESLNEISRISGVTVTP